MNTKEANMPRTPHEPYGKKNPNRVKFEAQSGRLRSDPKTMQEVKELVAKGMDYLTAIRTATEHERARERKKQEEKLKKSKQKNIAVGSADYIEGKDLFSIKPSADNFNSAILETSQPLKHEVFYIFDDKGKVAGRWGGKKASVEPDFSGSKFSATLHNHPRYYGAYDTFSSVDISSYCSLGKKINHYVVTEKYVYKFNMGNMKKDSARNLRYEIDKNIDIASKERSKYIKEHNLTKQAYMEATLVWSNRRHEILEELAPKYGYEYSRMTVEAFKKKNNIV